MEKEKLPDLCTRTIKLSDLRFEIVGKGRAGIFTCDWFLKKKLHCFDQKLEEDRIWNGR